MMYRQYGLLACREPCQVNFVKNEKMIICGGAKRRRNNHFGIFGKINAGDKRVGEALCASAPTHNKTGYRHVVMYGWRARRIPPVSFGARSSHLHVRGTGRTCRTAARSDRGLFVRETVGCRAGLVLIMDAVRYGYRPSRIRLAWNGTGFVAYRLVRPLGRETNKKISGTRLVCGVPSGYVQFSSASSMSP